MDNLNKLIQDLPDHLQHKIIKMNPHPVAEILKDKIVEYNKYFDEQVRRCKSWWKWKDGDEYIVVLSHNFYHFWQDNYATKYSEWEQEAPSPFSKADYFRYYDYDSEDVSDYESD